MSAIFHIAEKPEWENALGLGYYRRSTRGRSLEEIGFIHCSTRSQIQAVAEFVFGDFEGQLMLLELELEQLQAHGLDVRFEYGGDGNLYPHIYGELPCHLVKSVSPFTFH